MTNILDNIIYKPWWDSSKDTAPKLLEIDDWSRVTPGMLRQYIADGYDCAWIDGYDKGPSPLTNALMSEVGPEIIALLIGANANVNAPTVLPDGTKMTPLEIVRSQAPSHENMQKELMLIRAGATDDVWKWLRQDAQYPVTYWKDVEHIGLWCGEQNRYAYRVFRAHPLHPTSDEPMYIVEQAGKISWANDININTVDTSSYGDGDLNIAIVRNELGHAFAEQFLADVKKHSFSVAMFKYYQYLASIRIHNDISDDRISAAAADFRKKHFSYNDWDELIYSTPNITAAAEYRKMQAAQFPQLYEFFRIDD